MFLRRAFLNYSIPFHLCYCSRQKHSPTQLLQSTRNATSLTTRIIRPPSLSFRRRDGVVRKTRPLPLRPSKRPHHSRLRRILWYLFGFITSGAVTYATLHPDNPLNHTFHGCIRVSRVAVALVLCVYDYRTAIRKGKNISETHTLCARRALKVFEKNGGIYIKIGQHLAALSYLLPIVTLPSYQADSLGMGLNNVCATRCLSTDSAQRNWPNV